MDFLLVWLFFVGLGLWTLRGRRLDAAGLATWLAIFGGFWLVAALLPPLAALRRGEARPRVALWLAMLALAMALLGSLPASPLNAPRSLRAFELALLLAAFVPALMQSPGPGTARSWACCLGLLAALGLAPPHLAAWLSAAALLLPLPALFDWPGRAAWERLLIPLFVLLAALGAWLAREDLRVALLLPLATICPVLVSLVMERWPIARVFLARTLATLLLLAALGPAGLGLHRLAESGRLDRYDAATLDFLEVQRWARAETLPGSVFLVPESQLLPNLVPSFWTLSRRSAWVDWRMGAAAHWLPDFYWFWSERLAEALALETPAERLAFARAKAIDFVILEGEEAPEGAAVAYGNAHYLVLVP